MVVASLVALSSLFAAGYSHSWAHCTNYHAVISGQDFDENECSGYIRQWSSVWGATSFATDRGTNYFGSNGEWCQSSFSSDIPSMYDDGYPYAEYYVGDTVRIVWPAKNHANYECFGNIPDTSMKLYYSTTVNRTSDPTTLGSDWVVLHDYQDGCTAGTDGCGFQNCPSFCDNTDGAPCFGDVEISSSDFTQGSGFYTFMWYWIFNGGTAAYTTCFEAFVHTSGGGSGTSAQTPSPTSPVASPTRTPTVAGGTYAPTESPTQDDSSGVGDAYLVIVPLCYDGASYDEDKIVDASNNAYGSNVVDWEVRYHTTGSGVWNATIQTFTDYGSSVTSGAYDYSDDSSLLCDEIESEFGTGTCEVCTPGDIRLYTNNEDFDTDDVDLPQDEDSTISIKHCNLINKLVSLVVVAGTIIRLF